MAKTERIQVRVDSEVKKQATELFDSLGLTVSDAITIFIHQSLNAKGLPFNINSAANNGNRR